MIKKLNTDERNETGRGAYNRTVPVFKPKGATSFSRFMGVERGQVMKTDEKEESKQGRLKIYVFGIYPDVTIRSPDDLPWAYPETPAMLGGKYQQGWTSVPEVGSWVSVRFDCGNINKPLYTGTIAGNQNKVEKGDASRTEPLHGKVDSSTTFDKPDKHEHDSHRYADKSSAKINYNTKLERKFKPMDNTPAQAGGEVDWGISWAHQHSFIKYPYNHIFSTGKHSIEFDNTDGYERLAISHGSGSHISMDWAGDQIAESKGSMWNTSGRNIVGSAERNVTNIAKQHRADITKGDSATVVTGKTEMYFGKPIADADLNIDFDSQDMISKVKVSPAVSSGGGGNAGSEGTNKDAYIEFAGDTELKNAQAFIQEVDGEYSRAVAGKTNIVCDDDLLIQVNGGEMTMKCNNVMNFEGSLIKLNCGGGATASKATMKGGGAGTGGGSSDTSLKGKKPPSATVNDDTTARNALIVESTTPVMEESSISKYDGAVNKDCSKI